MYTVQRPMHEHLLSELRDAFDCASAEELSAFLAAAGSERTLTPRLAQGLKKLSQLASRPITAGTADGKLVARMRESEDRFQSLTRISSD